MKALISTFLFLTLFVLNAQAQEDKSKRKSPPVQVHVNQDGVSMTIDYSSPAVKGRTTWGGRLVPYDQIWRTGANEATWIEISKDIKVEGEALKAGKYSIFTIAKKDGTATIIFNKIWDQWGGYRYDDSKDALRVEVKKHASDVPTERMSFEVVDGTIKLIWDDWYLPIQFSTS